MAKEEIVLDLSVDQGSMITELERTKRAIIELKKEQQDLTKAYKAGNVTIEEYASESVRLEAILKKEQQTYTNTQKAVTGVKTKMDDLIKSNKDLSKSFEQNINNATVFGTNIGGVKNSIAAMTTGVGGAIAAVTALGALYARSANGAKDLEFAQNQLSAAFGLAGNSLAELVGANGTDGEGLLTKFLNLVLKSSIVGITDKLGLTDIVKGSKDAALAIERLQDLQREELGVRATVGDRLADNQELLSKIQDSQTQYNEKLHLTGEIISNITKNEDELVAVKQKQIAELEEQKKSAKDVEAFDTKILEIQRDISNVQKDAERKRQGVVRLESNLLDIENKRIEANKKLISQKEFQASEVEREKRIRDLTNKIQGEGDISGVDDPFGTKAIKNQEIKLSNETANAIKNAEKKKRDEFKKTSKAHKDYLDLQLEQTKDNFNQLAGLFSQGSDARRAFGLAAIGVDTAQAIAALTAQSEENPANAFTFGGASIAQFAAGIIRIFANIAAAKQFIGGEFAGGGNFVTTKPTYIKVGDNPGGRELVTVRPLSGRGQTRVNKDSGIVQFGGGGSMMFDGQSSSASSAINQALASANAIKKMPRPVVGVKEIVRVMGAIEVKQNISKQ